MRGTLLATQVGPEKYELQVYFHHESNTCFVLIFK